MPNDHLYDPETGDHIATIQDGVIISDSHRETIGHIRDGIAYGLDGQAWGPLSSAQGATGPSPMPEAMRQILKRDP